MPEGQAGSDIRRGTPSRRQRPVGPPDSEQADLDQLPIGRVKWIEGSKHTGKDNTCWYLFDSKHRVSPVFNWRDQGEAIPSMRTRLCEQCGKRYERWHRSSSDQPRSWRIVEECVGGIAIERGQPPKNDKNRSEREQPKFVAGSQSCT